MHSMLLCFRLRHTLPCCLMPPYRWMEGCVSSIVNVAVVVAEILPQCIRCSKGHCCTSCRSAIIAESSEVIAPGHCTAAYIAKPLLRHCWLSHAFNAAVLPAPSHSTVLFDASVSMDGGGCIFYRKGCRCGACISACIRCSKHHCCTSRCSAIIAESREVIAPGHDHCIHQWPLLRHCWLTMHSTAAVLPAPSHSTVLFDASVHGCRAVCIFYRKGRCYGLVFPQCIRCCKDHCGFLSLRNHRLIQ